MWGILMSLSVFGILMSLSVFTRLHCLPHAYYDECAFHKCDRNTIKRSFCALQLKQMGLKTDLHPLSDYAMLLSLSQSLKPLPQ